MAVGKPAKKVHLPPPTGQECEVSTELSNLSIKLNKI